MLDLKDKFQYYIKNRGKNIMQYEFIDMLFFIAERFDNFHQFENKQGKIKNELLKNGFDTLQVDALLNWLSQRIPNHPQNFRRVFSNREKEVFKPDTLQLLVRLARMGVINQREIELILVRAEIENYPVDIDEFKRMVSIIIEGGNEPLTGVFVPYNTNFIS